MDRRPARSRAIGLGVFLLALLVGLAVNVLQGERTPRGDEIVYDALARRLVATGAFGSPGQQAYRAPLYPLLLSGLYRVFGERVAAGQGAELVLAAIMVWLAYALARRLAGLRAGLLAAAFVMLDSYWWLNLSALMQENLFSVLFSGAVLCLIAGIRGPASSPRTSLFVVVSGLLFGASLLAKFLLVPLFALVCVVPLFSRRGTRLRSLALCAAFTVAALVPLSPWVARNYLVLHEFVPFSTESGRTFYGSHCPEAYSDPSLRGKWCTIDVAFTPEEKAELQALSPAKAERRINRMRWEKGLAEISRHSAGETLMLVAFKWLRFWSPSVFFAASSPLLLAAKVSLLGLNSLIVVAFFLSLLKREFEPWIPALAVAAAMVTVTVFCGLLRFRYALCPVISAYAAAFLCTRFPLVRRRDGGATSAG
ncbi:glycosyltransferase family 39 protein [Candidatus Sumerlaeota bacterium]|nr:glycosyltransferase family 39 protein [Candidatus Sumerlaeota bacterium]